MDKLIKIKNNWYLIDTIKNEQPLESSVVLYANSIPTFASFIDYNLRICYLSGGIGDVSFDDFEVIVASTNPFDGAPMLNVEMIENKVLENFIFDTVGKENFGVLYPDEDDSVMGYFPTQEECIANLKEWFSHKPYPILARDNYYTRYTKHVPNNKIEPYLIDGFVNLIKVGIKRE